MRKRKIISLSALFLALSVANVFGAGVPLTSDTTTGLLDIYQSQGPFPQDAKKCILGSFKLFKGLKDNAQAENESEFKQWKAACAKMAPCKHALGMTFENSVHTDAFEMYDCIPRECLPEYHDKQRGGCFEDKEYMKQINNKVKAAEAAEKAKEKELEQADKQRDKDLKRSFRAIDKEVDAEFASDEKLEKEQRRREKQNDKLDKKCPRWTQINEQTQLCAYYEYQFKDNKFGSAPIKNFWLITKTDNVDPAELKKNQTEFTNWQNACKNTKESNYAKSMVWEIYNKNQDGCKVYACVPESCSEPDMIIRKPDADNGGYCILPDDKRDGAKCKPDDKNAKTGEYNAESGKCEITECKDKYTKENGKCVKKPVTQTQQETQKQTPAEQEPEQNNENNEQILSDKSAADQRFFADLERIIDAFKTVIEKIRQNENNTVIDSDIHGDNNSDVNENTIA